MSTLVFYFSMGLDFRNINTLWCSLIVETLFQLGLTTAIICPGSRSTPLTIAFARHPDLETIPILDERSASFFALGIAKKKGIPVVLICTSGTAGANFYPAIIEAKYSNVPLIILTADRPPQLRNCHAGQTIDQVKLYGNYPNWQTELALPSIDKETLFYLRQNVIQAWERSLFPYPGVVHLNLPFSDPLFPIQKLELNQLNSTLLEQELVQNMVKNLPFYQDYMPDINSLFKEWQHYSKGIIIAGVDGSYQPEKYCEAIALMAELLKFPVLAEALSPVRNYANYNPYLITTYDLILRNSELAQQLRPEIVILIGELPTSKELRNWLNKIKSKTYIIKNSPNNLDAIHGNSIHLRTSLENFIINLTKSGNSQNSLYLETWLDLEIKKNQNINLKMQSIKTIFEGKVAWILSHSLPLNSSIFIANSMSVRYCEFFWQKNHQKIQPYFNRGANGIDGTLSTALGVAHHNESTVMLTGDLAFLHDINGFLSNKYFQGHLTIILVNNNGGGIFEMLPISEFEPPFEEFFATPQNLDFRNICDSYNVEYQLITSWEKLEYLLNPLPTKGIRVLELKTNRKTDSLWMQQHYPCL
jgi:2-succinyl-5-enolpyruvyl-6-hydroxy-3-cyclohexene-1-carboxylate synthase